MQARRALKTLGIALIALGLGCSAGDDGTGPEAVPNFAGQWSGGSSLRRSIGMSLTQSGRTVSGNMTMSGVLPAGGRQLDGEVDDLDRLVWIVLEGCRVLAGTLTLGAAGQTMSGAININDSGCSTNNSASGTLTLNRQQP